MARKVLHHTGSCRKPEFVTQSYKNSEMEIFIMVSNPQKKLRSIVLAASAVAGLMLAQEASAHTTAIGWSLGASAGQVNLFMGTYHDDNVGDGPNLEGSAQLTGPGGYNVTSAFNTEYDITNLLPSNLLPGNISWYPGYDLSQMNSWEAVTMSGLTTPGVYSFAYSCPGNCSAHWSPLSTNITFTFSNVDLGGGGTNVGSVPEPATLALLGMGLVGIGYSRRKLKA